MARLHASLAVQSQDPAKESADLAALIRGGVITTQTQIKTFEQNWDNVTNDSSDAHTRLQLVRGAIRRRVGVG